MYNKKVMDHFMNPRNVGEIEDADGVGEAGNPHGDHMKMEEAWNLTNEAVAEALEGLPSGKLECSVVSREAIHRAINDYRKKQGLETLPEQT